MKLPRLTLAVCMGIQLAILVGVLVNAALPIWIGRDIQLLAAPVDPRQLLRGQYARLEYRFNYLAPGDLPSDLDFGRYLEYGTPVYVVLRDSAGLMLPAALRRERPQGDTLYVQVQLATPHDPNSNLRLEAGLESWYASPAEVNAVEAALRRWTADGPPAQVIVRARVARNGAARIVGLTVQTPQVKKR